MYITHMARCQVLVPVAYCQVVAGGNREEEHWTDFVCRGLRMSLMGLGMLWVFFTVFTFFLVAPLLLSVGFLFFGWAPILAMGESLHTSYIDVLCCSVCACDLTLCITNI